MVSRIKYCLNNECGGPNLEQIFGIALAMVFAACIIKMATSVKKLNVNTIKRMGAMDDYFG